MAGSNSILSFKDWCRVNRSIPTHLKQSRYSEYLKTNTVDILSSDEIEEEYKDEIKEFYKGFLRRLLVIFDADPEVKILNNIDFDDNQQLISAIPLFSKKIKDMADKLKNYRTQIKNKKQFYSSKGSKTGLKHIFGNTKFECDELYDITCE